MKTTPTQNRGTLGGYNKIISCHCCGRKTQSQIGSGTDLCQGCYDFSGESNAHLDGGPFSALPKPTHGCKRCESEYTAFATKVTEQTPPPQGAILVRVERSQVGRSHYRYTGTFNDNSKQSILSRRFFQYGYSDPEGALYFSKTKPTGHASSFVAIQEASQKAHMNNNSKKTAAKSKKAAQGKKDKKAAVSKRLDTGYVAAIRDLLLKQKFTISQASEKIAGQFPDKGLQSIKRIAANVAKRMRKNPETKDLRWVPGAPVNTGYMARIDELLRGGKHTTRQIGETVAKEFDKEATSAKKVVRARLKRLRDGGDKSVKPLLEADIREKVPAKKAKSTPKAAKTAGRVKAPGKTPKTKGKGKKAPRQAVSDAPAPADNMVVSAPAA
jgi:hypothetical protein